MLTKKLWFKKEPNVKFFGLFFKRLILFKLLIFPKSI